jgi:hypothetical protein
MAEETPQPVSRAPEDPLFFLKNFDSTTLSTLCMFRLSMNTYNSRLEDVRMHKAGLEKALKAVEDKMEAETDKAKLSELKKELEASKKKCKSIPLSSSCTSWEKLISECLAGLGFLRGFHKHGNLSDSDKEKLEALWDTLMCSVLPGGVQQKQGAWETPVYFTPPYSKKAIEVKKEAGKRPDGKLFSVEDFVHIYQTLVEAHVAFSSIYDYFQTLRETGALLNNAELNGALGNTRRTIISTFSPLLVKIEKANEYEQLSFIGSTVLSGVSSSILRKAYEEFTVVNKDIMEAKSGENVKIPEERAIHTLITRFVKEYVEQVESL